MINSFNACQECLNGQRFCVIYDERTREIQEIDGDANAMKAAGGGMVDLKRISYFSDFILMQ